MKAAITIRTDQKIKKLALQTAKRLGIPLSTIMHALLLQFIREKKINIELNSDSNKLSEKGEKMLLEALVDEEVHQFDSLDDLSFMGKM